MILANLNTCTTQRTEQTMLNVALENTQGLTNSNANVLEQGSPNPVQPGFVLSGIPPSLE